MVRIWCVHVQVEVIRGYADALTLWLETGGVVCSLLLQFHVRPDDGLA